MGVLGSLWVLLLSVSYHVFHGTQCSLFIYSVSDGCWSGRNRPEITCSFFQRWSMHRFFLITLGTPKVKVNKCHFICSSASNPVFCKYRVFYATMYTYAFWCNFMTRYNYDLIHIIKPCWGLEIIATICLRCFPSQSMWVTVIPI